MVRALVVDAEERALQSAIDAGDLQVVARLVVSGASTKVRQAAAHAVEDPQLLRQLIREVRGGNDNSVYKILTAKRDVELAQARRLEQTRAESQAASEALERHSQRPYDALYVERLDRFESRWTAVADQVDAEQRGRVQQWIDRAHETVAEHRRQLAAQAAREKAAADEAAAERRQREHEARASAEAAAEQARILEEQRQALAGKQQAEQDAVRKVGELIRKALGALSDGGTARAVGLRQTIEQELAGAPPLPANLASRLQQIDKQLDDFKDWKSFSVTPKRAELIREMQLLVEASLDPLALAERIRSLQDEWRTLSKGAGENADEDWQRFQEAAEKAYRPCKEYFAAQALTREQNLQHRQALIERLSAFEAGHHWEQPDWRAVITTLREMKLEWRRYLAVDRSAGKPQQEQFTALTASLERRLEAEYARNLKQREALIEHARLLLVDDDSRKGIDVVKQLQKQWQALGPVPREADQRLWAEFRQHCDAVFQKRDQDLAVHAAGLQNNRAQALALCEQLEQMAELEGVELLDRGPALGELRKAFEALGEFPRADTRELRNRFEQGLKRCQESLARQQRRDAERAWDDLFEATHPVQAYRLALAHGLGAEPLGALKAAAETCIASVQRWPKGGCEALSKALADPPATDLGANEGAARLLCIRAEMLSDQPTPPEDQALRRDYRLQRLVQGMGQRFKADETMDALAIEWVHLGPVEPAIYAPLLQRFRRCREPGHSRVDGRLPPPSSGQAGARPDSRR